MPPSRGSHIAPQGRERVGFKVRGLGFGVYIGFGIRGTGFRTSGSGFRV